MKLYIFQETGEFRIAQDREWYQDDVDDFSQSDGPTYLKRKIFAMTEMEIPDNIEIIRIGVKEINDTSSYHFNTIPIVHPKPKIKKWQWLYRGKDGSCEVTPPFALEQEMFNYIKEINLHTNLNYKVIRKLEESEIDVWEWE